jgi:hypothetical protein
VKGGWSERTDSLGPRGMNDCSVGELEGEDEEEVWTVDEEAAEEEEEEEEEGSPQRTPNR